MFLGLYVASVCLSLATHLLIGTGVGLKLAKEGYTSVKPSEKPVSIWSILLSILVCFIPVINVIAMYRTIKSVKNIYGDTKKRMAKEESTKKEEVKTEIKEEKAVEKEKELTKEVKDKSYSDMSLDEKKAYLEKTKDYLTKLKEDISKETKGPVLKKKLEPMRS